MRVIKADESGLPMPDIASVTVHDAFPDKATAEAMRQIFTIVWEKGD